MLLSYAWQDEGCYPGQEKMAEKMAVDTRTVRRMIAELQDHGLLDVRQRGLGKTNYYKLKVTVRTKTVLTRPDKTVRS
jgi:Mn-dependent DtxR family transcriptional regulator